MIGDQDGSRDVRSEYARHRRRVRVGQVLLALAAIMAAVHLVAHLTSSPSGSVDLLAGYPMAAMLFLVGAVLAGRADPTRG
ncbi:hypothetical protein BN12_150047 [Nostocoides japonicum T1-X7]|uniref:Uncharacterized protein n=1 Tax=Nostocoides japonicum T1-X7 TaxID=1194083 RepID=A0A077LTJ2_9MICO|nr:hypothetical protein [Tetrasphaera japonica]CCH76873.1 hypothetical protein BN12_150047 [Tetrasphaera japonica T1-X7]